MPLRRSPSDYASIPRNPPSHHTSTRRHIRLARLQNRKRIPTRLRMHTRAAPPTQRDNPPRPPRDLHVLPFMPQAHVAENPRLCICPPRYASMFPCSPTSAIPAPPPPQIPPLSVSHPAHHLHQTTPSPRSACSLPTPNPQIRHVFMVRRATSGFTRLA